MYKVLIMFHCLKARSEPKVIMILEFILLTNKFVHTKSFKRNLRLAMALNSNVSSYSLENKNLIKSPLTQYMTL